MRGLIKATVITVLVALAGVVVEYNFHLFIRSESEADPLNSTLVAQEQPPLIYNLLLPDVDNVPQSVWLARNCDDLYEAALGAGGLQLPMTDPGKTLVNVRGTAETGATITSLRAKITRRVPAIDGMLATCGGEGSQDPISMFVDLSQSDNAFAVRLDPEDPYDRTGAGVDQFNNGWSIDVAQNESVILNVGAMLPQSEAVDWHLEATIRVGDSTETRTVVIDNAGTDFHSPGARPENEYSFGRRISPDAYDWGIVTGVGSRREKYDDTWLSAVGDFDIALTDDMDVYRPPGYQTDSSYGHRVESEYFWVRKEGRRLLTYGPSEEDPTSVGPPTVGEGPCGPDLASVVISQGSVVNTIEDHHGQQFEHSRRDFTCAAYMPTASAPPPNVETFTYYTARGVGSDTVFTVRGDQLSKDELDVALNIIDTVEAIE